MYLTNMLLKFLIASLQIMTKNMKIVDNCDPGTEFFAKGFKPEMLPPSEDVIEKLHIERWWVDLCCDVVF